MIKKAFTFFIAAVVLMVVFANCSSNSGNNNRETTMNDNSIPPENNKVRLSMITVDSTRLDEYNAFLKEEIEASMRLEPGVLTLYAVSETNNPNKVVILEIYADEEAYQKHIKTPHFLKYKEGTLDMVKSLELIDTTPLIPRLKIKQSFTLLKH